MLYRRFIIASPFKKRNVIVFRPVNKGESFVKEHGINKPDWPTEIIARKYKMGGRLYIEGYVRYDIDHPKQTIPTFIQLYLSEQKQIENLLKKKK